MIRRACFVCQGVPALICLAFASLGVCAEHGLWADRRLADYFCAETRRLADDCLDDVKTLADWQAKRPEYRRQLREMLGLDPLPEKTPLKPTITGTLGCERFAVERLHFQSMPGLYVTANLYIPKGLSGPAPTILYVCGHGRAVKDGVSYGNKAVYHHHGAWFARHGYVCLIIDTVQLGEIEGTHHGTYRYGMWWWNSRGYTPAGVEAWNCVRALDYLQTREEVDPDRFGVTGRSGGGIYSWWIAAIDDRIKAAVPVAGITDLQNYVVDGCVEGHCDCMFMVNTFRWDFPLVTALVAPRPLLISNSDKDTIFPLDGVLRVHEKVRRIYRLYKAETNLGLHITEGPHKDTQELRVHAFTWFNRHLKGQEGLIDEPAVRLFEPEQLKVFGELPADEINTNIHATFVPIAQQPEMPGSREQWNTMRERYRKSLRQRVFRGWPAQDEAEPPGVTEVLSAKADGMQLAAYDFTSQPYVRLRLFVVRPAQSRQAGPVTLNALDDAGWTEWLAAMRVGFETPLSEYAAQDPDHAAFERLKAENGIGVFVCPRGIGPDAWSGDERKQTHIRRRFMLLGQTLDGMRVWDVRRAIQAVRQMAGLQGRPLHLRAGGDMAGIVLYASLFEGSIGHLELTNLPASHADGPIFLNVLRYLDVPQTVAMAAERSDITLRRGSPSDWRFAVAVHQRLGWNHALSIQPDGP